VATQRDETVRSQRCFFLLVVMFADIAGFTAWSSCTYFFDSTDFDGRLCEGTTRVPHNINMSMISCIVCPTIVRDPSQVFKLLEAVYSAFDAVARRRGVFKVETIGDSYVCVTYVIKNHHLGS
jgi:Adenylate and Guanylate cyclase catalytic domain